MRLEIKGACSKHPFFFFIFFLFFLDVSYLPFVLSSMHEILHFCLVCPSLCFNFTFCNVCLIIQPCGLAPVCICFFLWHMSVGAHMPSQHARWAWSFLGLGARGLPRWVMAEPGSQGPLCPSAMGGTGAVPVPGIGHCPANTANLPSTKPQASFSSWEAQGPDGLLLLLHALVWVSIDSSIVELHGEALGGLTQQQQLECA